MGTFKVAILGAGSIAKLMADTLNGMEGVECYAVGARNYDRAQAFADEHGFTKAFGSYEEMLGDPEIDLVYIATPHSHHYDHIKLCVEYKKNILCEKAFTVNAKQAEEVLKLAEDNSVFLTEAIWTRYMPMRTMIDEVISSGKLGKVTSLSANLGYNVMHIERMIKPELAGGALLDLSVYALNFASMVFGDDVETMHASVVKADTGVDAQNNIVITYKDGKMATLYNTGLCNTDREGVVNGDKGYMKIDNINNYQGYKIYNSNHELIETVKAPQQITGYEYEVMASQKAIAEGKLECEEMPHAQTIHMMQVMDAIREQWGIVYPCE